jgi:hypothetical protein
MRIVLIIALGLLCYNSTVGQIFNGIISDKEFEDSLITEILDPNHEDADYVGVEDKHYNYASFTVDWKDLPVGIYPGKETEFDVLFREILSDTLLGLVDKDNFEDQFQKAKKSINLKFWTNHKEINWTHKTKLHQSTVYYTTPIVSSDKRHLIIAKDYRYNEGNTPNKGHYVLKLYKRNGDGWKFVTIATSGSY